MLLTTYPLIRSQRDKSDLQVDRDRISLSHFQFPRWTLQR